MGIWGVYSFIYGRLDRVDCYTYSLMRPGQASHQWSVLDSYLINASSPIEALLAWYRYMAIHIHMHIHIQP
jgi:hypothetical protein